MNPNLYNYLWVSGIKSLTTYLRFTYCIIFLSPLFWISSGQICLPSQPAKKQSPPQSDPVRYVDSRKKNRGDAPNDGLNVRLKILPHLIHFHRTNYMGLKSQHWITLLIVVVDVVQSFLNWNQGDVHNTKSDDVPAGPLQLLRDLEENKITPERFKEELSKIDAPLTVSSDISPCYCSSIAENS